jgi:hypothetical protein
MTSDNQTARRLRDGRLQQIREHVDKIEVHLDDIAELVARLDMEPYEDRAQPTREPSITGACWPNPPVQENSASL